MTNPITDELVESVRHIEHIVRPGNLTICILHLCNGGYVLGQSSRFATLDQGRQAATVDAFRNLAERRTNDGPVNVRARVFV